MNKILKTQGIAVFPHFNKPDTQFKAEGEYHSKVRITAEQADELLAILEPIRAEEVEAAAERKKGKRPKLSDHPVQPEFDSETGEETGMYLLKVAMKASGVSKKTNKPWNRALPIFDAAGQPVPTSKFIRSGSEVIVAYEPKAWTNAKNECGVKCYLEAVQVIRMADGGGDASRFGFGAVAGGFVAGDEPEVDQAVDDEPEPEDQDAGSDAGYEF